MPVNFYSAKVLRDCVVVGEDCAEVVKVAVTHIIDAKIVYNEDKHNGATFFAPKSERIGGLVVSCLIEALS